MASSNRPKRLTAHQAIELFTQMLDDSDSLSLSSENSDYSGAGICSGSSRPANNCRLD